MTPIVPLCVTNCGKPPNINLSRHESLIALEGNYNYIRALANLLEDNMIYRLFFVLSLLAALPFLSFAQFHYPLDNGNVWYYEGSSWEGGSEFSRQCSVRGDSIMSNGKLYSRLVCQSSGQWTEFQRQEANLVYLWNSYTLSEDVLFEFGIDSVGLVLIGSIPSQFDTSLIYYDGWVTEDDTIFGRTRKTFRFYIDDNPGATDDEYSISVADSIGIISTVGSWAGSRLSSAIIDGMSYGSVTSVDNPQSAYPPTFSLRQNYPNPFNPSTTIRFTIHQSGKARLDIFNVLGQQVDQVSFGELESGSHEVKWDGSELQSGVYYCRLRTERLTQTIKLLLMK